MMKTYEKMIDAYVRKEDVKRTQSYRIYWKSHPMTSMIYKDRGTAVISAIAIVKVALNCDEDKARQMFSHFQELYLLTIQ